MGGISRIWTGQWERADPDGSGRSLRCRRFLRGGGEAVQGHGGAAALCGCKGGGCRCFRFLQVLVHGLLVKLVGLALDDLQGPRGALAQAGSQAVAEHVLHESCLAVDDLDGPFRAGGHTLAAAVAELFIDFDDLSFCFHVLSVSALFRNPRPLWGRGPGQERGRW